MVSSRVIALLVLLALTAAGCGAAPTAEPGGPVVVSTAGAGGVRLATAADHYPAAATAIDLTLSNEGSEPIYTGICGPWEVIRDEDPDRPAWFIACEIDYLGHKIEPGQTFSDRLEMGNPLAPGSYRVRVKVYSGCTLGEPLSISAGETNYGDFGACTRRQDIDSAPFVVE